MELKITGKNTDIAESLQVFTERKIGKLEKLAKKELRATVTFSEQTSKKSSKSCTAEVVLDSQGKVFSAKDDKENFYIAVDSVVEKLRRQLKKSKNKRIDKNKDRMGQKLSTVVMAENAIPSSDHNELRISNFNLRPMTVEDALLKLLESGKDFLMFVNEDQSVNCVYKIEGGQFGLLVPEAS